jgi:hypothetical protein
MELNTQGHHLEGIIEYLEQLIKEEEEAGIVIG